MPANRLLVFLFACFAGFISATAQQRIIVSPIVGESIDSLEKVKYHLFPYFSTATYEMGEFYKYPDSSISLRVKRKDGLTDERSISKNELLWIHNMIEDQNSVHIRKMNRREVFYISADAGIGFNGPSQNLYVNTTSYMGYYVDQVVYGSFGKGLNFTGSLGYMITRNVGAELGLGYLNADKEEFFRKDERNNSLNNQKIGVSMWRIMPQMKLSTSGDRFKFYLKQGLIIGVFPRVSVLETYVAPGYYTGVTQTTILTAEETGNISWGAISSAGVSCKLKGRLYLTAEMRMISQSYSPAKGEVKDVFVDGVSQPILYKTVTFQDEHDSRDRVTALRFYYSLNSVGLNIGLHIFL